MSKSTDVMPKTAKASFAEIKKIIDMGWINIPPEKTFNGNAAPGDFLEHLLGGQKNNKDSPDLNDWEVKFHGGNALITLFHKEPLPRRINYYLVHEHGWPMQDDENNNISFRHTLCGKSNRGLYVKNEIDRIVIRHQTLDMPMVYWLHNTLLNAVSSKLRRLILVEGKFELYPTKRVHYESATAYWDIDLTGFCQALEIGKICIDFDARTTKGRNTPLRNHGTKFRINISDIPSLYLFSKKIT